MATYYVYSGATGTNTGGSWTDAFLTFAQAVTAATVSGDIIKVHYEHTEDLAADTTYTFAASVAVYSVNKDSSDAPTVMGVTHWIGHSTTNRFVAVTGAADSVVYIYGLTFRTAGGTADNLTFGGDQLDLVLDSCYIWLGGTNAASFIRLGITTGTANTSYTKAKNCTFRFGNTAQIFRIGYRVELEGGSYSADGAALANGLFGPSAQVSGSFVVTGMDLSALGANPLVYDCPASTPTMVLSNCKLGTGFTAFATQTASRMNAPELYLFNCSSADQHYHIGHYNGLGSTVCVTTPYANDGALYDGTNHVTWKIDSTADASFLEPYCSPWIDKYNATLSSITPFVEILRDGSATAFQDDEVWGEFSYQGTSGSTQSTIASDRMALLGTPADQAAGIGLSSWSGESATAWSGKLAPSAITPAEIGYMRARVCVGQPSTTVYVDPIIRT